MSLNKSRFEKYIEDNLKSNAIFMQNGNSLTFGGVQRQHGLVISGLASRGMDSMINSIEGVGFLPRVAINRVIKKIHSMELNDSPNGEFMTFVQYLYDQLSRRTPDIRNLMDLKKLINVLKPLKIVFTLPSNYVPYDRMRDEYLRITENTWYDPEFYSSDEENEDFDFRLDEESDLLKLQDQCKRKLSKIYQDCILMESSYPSIDNEGVELANELGIHVVVCDTEMKIVKSFGPDPSDNIPTITLQCKENNNNQHYVLDKVNDEHIPHSILPGSNSLFECFAQVIWEISCQFSNVETNASKALRRSFQTFIGVSHSLIPRSIFLNLLGNQDSLVQELSIEILQQLPDDLLPEEVDILKTLQKNSASLYISIRASVILYLKGDNEQKNTAYENIISSLNYYFTNRRIAPECYIEEKSHILTIICKLKSNQFILQSESLSLINNLANSHPSFLIRIKAAEVLYCYGGDDTKQNAQKIVENILLMKQPRRMTSEDFELLQVAAIHAVVNTQNTRESVIQALMFLTQVPSENLRRAGCLALENLGTLSNKPFKMIEKPEGIFFTNGDIFFAKKLNRTCIASSIAVDNCLLQKMDSVAEPVDFIQRYLVSRKKKHPNWASAAFLQSLIVSIKKYYNIPLLCSDEQYLSALYPDINPTLPLFDMLLIDFISEKPKGIWRTHKHNVAHFTQMKNCHRQVSKESTSSTGNLHSKVIMIIMKTLIKSLYRAIAVFKDHELFSKAEFTDDELAYMNTFKLSQQE